ncbi:MAG: beta-propeller fold lactonase family protein [Anaerolineales bacterium]|nr:beta-propeller fold lactonase family protein [Anaerolineales bacterium]
MKKALLFVLALFLGLTLFLPGAAADVQAQRAGLVVVANRASGSISVISARSDALLGTVPLPEGEKPPEPMYVTYSRSGHHVFVGDRANDRVVVFDAGDFSVVTTIPTGAGVFHMWADPQDRQLWVNNDVDNTATVIDPVGLTVLATVPMPADLIEAGYKPHDVILDPSGRLAYVTLLGPDPDHDMLVQFSTRSFNEINRVPVGKDPHVSLTRRNRLLYVPAQNSNVLTLLNRFTLEQVDELNVPGAHGAGMAPNGQVFYTTNLPGGGADGLFAIDTQTNTILGTAETPYPVPHNVVVTRNGKLFVTHSGDTSDKVTIYGVSMTDPIPVLIGEVTVEFNPFGIAYVP